MILSFVTIGVDKVMGGPVWKKATRGVVDSKMRTMLCFS